MKNFNNDIKVKELNLFIVLLFLKIYYINYAFKFIIRVWSNPQSPRKRIIFINLNFLFNLIYLEWLKYSFIKNEVISLPSSLLNDVYFFPTNHFLCSSIFTSTFFNKFITNCFIISVCSCKTYLYLCKFNLILLIYFSKIIIILNKFLLFLMFSIFLILLIK